MNIAGVGIGGNAPCRFVAEISNNHNGSLDRALRLIDAAKASGADFVKFQCYTPDELVALRGDGPAPEPWGSQGWTMKALYEKAQTPHAWFPKLVEHCKVIGMPWFSSVFGLDSLALLQSLDCPLYKVAALDRRSAWFDTVTETGQLTMVSERGHNASGVADLTLLCPHGYPQTAFQFKRGSGNIGPSFTGVGTFDEFDGFSFHGTDDTPCVVAATLGAKIIETHFHLDDEPSELESNVSLTASQFKKMVEDVRRVEEMLA